VRHPVAISRAQPRERSEPPLQPTLCRRYDSLAHFYRADQRRLHSRELDVGLWWREHANGQLHRAAWVHDTGELYLVRLGDPTDGGGEVELLARESSRERLEAALEGWREQCGGPRSLAWLRERSRRLWGRSLPGPGSDRTAQAVRERGKRCRPSSGTGSQLAAESTNCR